MSRQAIGAVVVWAWSATLALAAGDSMIYYGDILPPELEGVYTRGLDYLSKSLVATEKVPERSYYEDQPGVIGLAVLAILAHGDDPNTGPHSVAVRKGLDRILKAQNPTTGYIGTTMYNHGFATLALAEAYGAVNDDRLGPALKAAVDLILGAQATNPHGGWRYSPESTDADTTVSGCQMVALLAARNAGISVPDAAIKKGILYFRSCQSDNGGFGYTSRDGSEAGGTRTAIGALVYALAKLKQKPEFKVAVEGMKSSSPDDRWNHGYPFYYEYYAAQGLFQSDMEYWKAWNKTMLQKFKELQIQDGSWPGSGMGGGLFTTASAMLTLALNYRYLPIYER